MRFSVYASSQKTESSKLVASKAWVEEKRPVTTYGHSDSFGSDEHIPAQWWDLLKKTLNCTILKGVTYTM